MSQWYYAVQGQQQGPIDEAELRQLAQTGKIGEQDLVWKEGMEDWQTFGQVFLSSGSAPDPQSSGDPAASVAPTAVSTGSFGAPAPGTLAADVGMKYDFGDFLCWGIAIMLVPCVSLFGYIALLVMFVLEFIELRKAVEAGKIEESQYSKVSPLLLVLGLFCCSIIFYPLFMHWRNQTGVFKPQPHAVWFSILILVISIVISIALNGTTVLVEAMNEIGAQ